MEISAIHRAQNRLAPLLNPTPLIHLGGKLFLKPELLHPTSSFKIRPAFNGILTHLGEAKARGVIASSSGNFAQAVAFAAKELGCSAQIIMTSNTSPFKIEKTRALGAEVILCGPSFEERWETTDRLRRETGRVFLHPYDSPETIAANGTIGLELHEQLPEGAFTVIAPVSGGGLLAGVASAIKQLRPHAVVLGAQPDGNASMKKSLEAGAPVRVPPFSSIADALVALTPGEYAFSLVKKYVDDVVLVSEGEIKAALKWLHSEHSLMAEPAGAVSVAAALKHSGSAYPSPVVCIVSGGNISADSHAALLAE